MLTIFEWPHVSQASKHSACCTPRYSECALMVKRLRPSIPRRHATNSQRRDSSHLQRSCVVTAHRKNVMLTFGLDHPSEQSVNLVPVNALVVVIFTTLSCSLGSRITCSTQAEIKTFDLRIGVVSHTLLSTKMKRGKVGRSAVILTVRYRAGHRRLCRNEPRIFLSLISISALCPPCRNIIFLGKKGPWDYADIPCLS